MNIFKKALIVALSIGLISVPTVTKEVEAAENICIAGSFQNWDPGKTKMTYNNANGKYEYFCNINNGTKVEFKFTKGSWGTDWGVDGGSNNISFTAPATGQYYFWTDGKKTGNYGAVYNSKTRVYFSNTSNWSKVNVYNWDLTSKWNFSAWPGSAISKVANGDNMYYYDCYAGSNIIFNNGSTKTSNLSAPVSGNNQFTFSTKKWDKTYKEHSIIYNYAYDGSPSSKEEKNQFVHNVETQVTFSKNYEREGYNLLGWSKENDNIVDYELDVNYKFIQDTNLPVYACWEEKPAVQYNVTFMVNGKDYSVRALEGQTFEEIVPTDKIDDTGITVVSWDKSGVVTSDTTVNATAYYTNIEKTEAQLGFDYTFEASTRIWFQVETSENPVVWAQINDNSDLGTNFPMTEDKTYVQSDAKKQYYCDIPLKYNKIQFKFKHWENNGKEVQYPGGGALENRDYFNNARWYNSAESTNVWQKEPDDFTGITSVSNVALRFSTSELLHSDFLGISSYGVDVQVDGKTKSSINKYVGGNGSFEWGTVLYNIDENNYNTEIKAVAWVMIGTIKYPLSDERMVTVADLADTYANDPEESKKLSTVAISACQYIVDVASK